MTYVIRRTDQSGGYLNHPGAHRTWIRNKYKARTFSTREEAQAECSSNETPEKL